MATVARRRGAERGGDGSGSLRHSLLIDERPQRVNRDADRAADVHGFEVAGADELVDRRASDREHRCGLRDRQ